jgi:hypothetical protein
MIEALLAPAHPHPFEPLLNEPFTRTFHHPGSQRQTEFCVFGVVNVISVTVQIVIELHQGLAGRLRKRLHLQGLQQVF